MTGNDRFLYSIVMTVDEAVRKIKQFYFSQKRLPSYQEMADLLGFGSKKSSFMWAKKLIEAGILAKDEAGKLIPKNLLSIPNLGVIRAGSPITVENPLTDSFDFYQYLAGNNADIFSLTVHGDSMIEEGINEGDIVIVDRKRNPRNLDIVAACVDNEWTVKFLDKSTDQIRLLPANANYSPIYPKESLTIGGVVVSVIRKYH